MWFRDKKLKIEKQVEANEQAGQAATEKTIQVIEQADKSNRALQKAMRDDGIVILIRKATSNG